MEFNEFKDRANFFHYVNEGPYPDDQEERNLYGCFCKLYNPSMKDREVLKATDKMIGVTLIMRDPQEDYVPETNHIVKIDKRLYANKLFNIEEIRQDTPDRSYITVVLSEV
ncbi:hypothetical protein H3984_11560 [Staphylococcus warneri]|uniref:hypothetical protein n=1 Tax=Staphylococcus warneri TaxID=1292 RepID=UPI00118CF7DE|nr:hypothetical protein [Staphylococcus warneri]MBF2179182.1 hypothetical protein [Staphylococcus warneri]MBF2181573.1 hypothetical protein [Staphylococcus warneri]MBF2186121.1 hypothetical protein [Staphylococcus warneri]MBF2263490.1 hypothetical protein [Staphylococcus warneri]MBF2266206.1 hypothetical protein [Staphylococcus warneri]